MVFLRVNIVYEIPYKRHSFIEINYFPKGLFFYFAIFNFNFIEFTAYLD